MEDPDDLHVCLKCHDQIVGLDNYIEHRRSNCRWRPEQNEKDVQVSSDVERETIPHKETESNSGIATESDLVLPVQEGNSGSSDARNNGEIPIAKRKRGRPRKIQQSNEGESVDVTLRSNRSPRSMRRMPSSPVRVVPRGSVQVKESEEKEKTEQPRTRRRLRTAVRYFQDDFETMSISEGDDEQQESHSGPQKTKKSTMRKPRTPLAAEERAVIAEYKVKNHYICVACSFDSTNAQAFLKHTRTIKHLESLGSNNPEAEFECDTCPARFFTEKALDKHRRRHEQQCRCSKCHEEFETRRELQLHHREEHGKAERQVGGGNVQACEICGKVLTRSYMKIHLRIHTGEKPFSCNICPFRTNQNGDLKMHQKRHFGIKDHKCSLCDFVTVRSSILKNHMKLHTKREKTEACAICQQKFYNKALLKSHIHLRHEPSRVHPCTFPDCTYKFKFKMELVTHMRRHTNEKPYLCTVCGYSGSTKQALTRHSRKHTGAKPFKCDYPGCSYMGRVSTHLTRHKRLHTGAKPYKCPYCSYRANTHENVRKHIRGTKKHAGLAVYVCKFCSDMQTDLYQDLVDHMRKMHADDYVTFDQVSHQSGLLADKETPPEVQNEASEKEQTASPTAKLSQDLQIAEDSTQVGQDVEIAVTTKGDGPDRQQEAGPTTQVDQNLCKEYILCQVIQDGSRQQHQQREDQAEDVEGSAEGAEGSEEMQEIQMVAVEEGEASEAIEMILRQAVSNGSHGPQDYIIL